MLTSKGLTGMLQYILCFSSRWLRLNFCSVVAAALEPSMSLTNLGHCIDTLSDYGPEREPCTDRAFSPRHGVLSGFVFSATKFTGGYYPGLASPGTLDGSLRLARRNTIGLQQLATRVPLAGNPR
jgi:hypothetical protein